MLTMFQTILRDLINAPDCVDTFFIFARLHIFNLLMGLYWKFDTRTTEWYHNPFTGIDKGPLFNMDEFSSEEWNMTIKALDEFIYQLLNFNGNG